MAQDVTIAGASYTDVPGIQVPRTGGGNALFLDSNDFQEKITASGMLKGDGNGGVTAAVSGNDYDTEIVLLSKVSGMGSTSVKEIYDALQSHKSVIIYTKASDSDNNGMHFTVVEANYYTMVPSGVRYYVVNACAKNTTLRGSSEFSSNTESSISWSYSRTAESTINKVTSLSSASTDTQYPSAKCVYDLVGNIESALAALR